MEIPALYHFRPDEGKSKVIVFVPTITSVVEVNVNVDHIVPISLLLASNVKSLTS